MPLEPRRPLPLCYYLKPLEVRRKKRMLKTLRRYWWTLALRGVFAVIFGVLALALPKLTVVVLVMLFAAWVVIDGVFSFMTGVAAARRGDRWGALIASGVVGIGIGLIAWIWPEMTAQVLLVLIALWALALGVFSLLIALTLGRLFGIAGIFALVGGISIVLGILLLANPMAGAVAMAWLVGLCAILVGVLLIFLGFTIRALARTASGYWYR